MPSKPPSSTPGRPAPISSILTTTRSSSPGRATLGLEILEQLPEIGTVVVPTGGGGLLAGTAFAIKTLRPSVTVIGVEIEAAAVYAESRRRGVLVRDFPRGLPTVADGIAVSVPSDLVWEITGEHVDHILVVNDAQTTAALAYVLDRSKIVVEAAGAVGVAALLEKLIPDDAPDPICIVLSGGNIDLMFLGKAVRHGLEASGRFRRVHGPGARPTGQPRRGVADDRRRGRQRRSWSSIIERVSGSVSAGWRLRSRSRPETPTTPPASPRHWSPTGADPA